MDFRKIAYLIEFINSGGDISKYSQSELANIYSKTHIKIQLLSHVIVALKKKDLIGVEIEITKSNNYPRLNLWLNKDKLPSGFFDEGRFRQEVDNINALKTVSSRLRTIGLKKLVDKLYTDKNVITWEI